MHHPTDRIVHSGRSRHSSKGGGGWPMRLNAKGTVGNFGGQKFIYNKMITPNTYHGCVMQNTSTMRDRSNDNPTMNCRLVRSYISLIGYSFRLTARVLLYAPSHRQDNTYHGLCYTSHGALAGTRNSSMGPPHEGSIRRPTAP